MENSTSGIQIEDIVLYNFKSYHGERKLGPMDPHFTAVVGPNGSGKSNLIEALLFVFGMPAKRMRMKTLKELIHNSSEHPHCPKASV